MEMPATPAPTTGTRGAHPSTASISRSLWRIGIVASATVVGIFILMLGGETMTDRADQRARTEQSSETRPLQDAERSVYRSEIAFADAMYGPTVLQDASRARLDREQAELDAIIAQLEGEAGVRAERPSARAAARDWTRARAHMAAAFADPSGTTRNDDAQAALHWMNR
ncbi:MAG: hypothetical protein JJE46_11410 [Acidimicrobiia bacterium]|nr:hypothetical protein [Acidimicrobiia bacterium]